MDNFAKTEMVIGFKFNECSIASADLARRAETLLAEQGLRQSTEYLVLSPERDAERMPFDAIPVSPAFQSGSGRPLRLMLAQNRYEDNGAAGSNGYLVAVTRGDLAMPLATFAQRRGSCDYVQLGDKTDDDSLVVTRADEAPRHAVIKQMQAVLSVDPAAYQRSATTIDDARPELIADAARYDRKRLMDSLLDARERYGIPRKTRLSKRGAEMVATITLADPDFDKFLDQPAAGPPTPEDIYTKQYLESLIKETRRGSLHYENAKRRLHEFMQNASFETAADSGSGLPGAEDQETRRLLVKLCSRVNDTLDVATPGGRSAAEHAQKLTGMLNVDGQLDAILGAYDPRSEQIFKNAAVLAVKGARETTAPINLGTTGMQSMVRYSVEVETPGDPVYDVRIAGRPESMPDELPADIFAFPADRTRDLQLSADDRQEVAGILGRVLVRR